ncbi:hypothetical protein C2R22_23280 (plasmid) [Salinigranum rubrum]|uniref:Serine protease n=1 Tax=Salinigranum rubrum TaxID=755307 RepID=A0A2I8VRD1_9EURY|nr:serine protease [Salinigranum rubrum]AUV84472.1 hypothetical protein C2R22_23280 [Salinigranum rubrum]
MESQFERLPAATLQISCGESTPLGDGTGFHFHSEDLVVTNAHVVEPAVHGSVPVFAHTESGEEAELSLRTYSPPANAGGHDYAILELQGDLGDDRLTLHPHTTGVTRGDEVLFAGYPHGIGDLLVHHARVSGHGDAGFYMDGSVNGGNSGGPIIDAETGAVVGLVTYKRYVEPDDLRRVIRELREVRDEAADRTGFIHERGADMQNQTRVLAETSELLEQVLKHNANSGIGIGKPIHHASQAIDELSD